MSKQPRYYNRAGQPIAMMDWAKNLNGANNAIVKTKLPSGTEVSTVWLGLNHNWGDGPPLIFETMVFGGRLDQEQRRYSSEEEAKIGHEETVARVMLTEAGEPSPGDAL